MNDIKNIIIKNDNLSQINILLNNKYNYCRIKLLSDNQEVYIHSVSHGRINNNEIYTKCVPNTLKIVSDYYLVIRCYIEYYNINDIVFTDTIELKYLDNNQLDIKKDNKSDLKIALYFKNPIEAKVIHNTKNSVKVCLGEVSDYIALSDFIFTIYSEQKFFVIPNKIVKPNTTIGIFELIKNNHGSIHFFTKNIISNLIKTT